MINETNGLEQLNEIGPVLAKRLEAAGLTDCDRILEAGEEGLFVVSGIRPREIPDILDKARQLQEEKKAARK